MKARALFAILGLTAAATIAAALSGCIAASRDYPNKTYQSSKHLDPREPSRLNYAGLESDDIKTACNNAVTRLLADPSFGTGMGAPLFAVEERYFESKTRIQFDVTAVVDCLRNELQNAAAGRVRVASSLPLSDRVGGSSPMEPDFIVGGRVTDVSGWGGQTIERYTQIAIEVVNSRTQEVVFSDVYSVKKKATSASGV